MPWGAPNPLKAVLLGMLVLQTVPRARTLGMLYTLSKLRSALSMTAPERSSELPPLLYS